MTPEIGQEIEKIVALQGWCTIEKATELAELVLTERPKTIVEIGVFGGRSLIPMALAAKTIGAAVHGVDPWTHGPCLEGVNSKENDEWWAGLDLEAIHAGYIQALKDFGVCEVVQTHRMTDEFALPKFKNGSIGLLHIDGCHSELASMRYATTWVPKVAKGGIVVADDIDWPTQGKMVDLFNRTHSLLVNHGNWAYWRVER